MPANFHSEDTSYKFQNKKICARWIEKVIRYHGKEPGEVNVIFTSTEYLLDLNRKYLNHNYNTDVITFNYNEGNVVSGDVFIGIEQVKINSIELGVSFIDELYLVIIHGILHLIGFNDKEEKDIIAMRNAEADAIKLLKGLQNGEII